ncbi:unnamed protein product [Symbiodinium sp. CCMP2592]|nr:unnamed protein product [Symbiodinium sp. CCMP2592]
MASLKRPKCPASHGRVELLFGALPYALSRAADPRGCIGEVPQLQRLKPRCRSRVHAQPVLLAVAACWLYHLPSSEGHGRYTSFGCTGYIAIPDNIRITMKTMMSSHLFDTHLSRLSQVDTKHTQPLWSSPSTLCDTLTVWDSASSPAICQHCQQAVTDVITSRRIRSTRQ